MGGLGRRRRVATCSRRVVGQGERWKNSLRRVNCAGKKGGDVPLASRLASCDGHGSETDTTRRVGGAGTPAEGSTSTSAREGILEAATAPASFASKATTSQCDTAALGRQEIRTTTWETQAAAAAAATAAAATAAASTTTSTTTQLPIESTSTPSTSSNARLRWPQTASGTKRRTFAVGSLAVAVICLSLSNRILNKLAMVSMREHLFFMAQLQTFCFVGFYGTTLLLRTKVKKIVSKEMLAINKLPFIAIGLLDCLSQACGFYGSSRLPGVFLPILSQIYIVSLLPLSMVFLRRRYTPLQLFGASMIFSGVALSALSGKLGDLVSLLKSCFGGGASAVVGDTANVGARVGADTALRGAAGALGTSGLDTVAVTPPVAVFLTYMVSQMFAACSTLVKERVFQSYEANQRKKAIAQRVDSGTESAEAVDPPKLDIFIVNTFGSTAQMFFAALLFPLNAHLRGIPLPDVPRLFLESASAFCGRVSTTSGISGVESGAPFFPVLYIVVNIVFNIATLSLTRASSGVVTSIAVSTSVPLSVLVFAFASLPLIGRSQQPIGAAFFFGLFILISGLITYNTAPKAKVKAQ